MPLDDRYNPAEHLGHITKDAEHQDLQTLNEELRAEHPSHKRINELVENLRSHPDLGAMIGIWVSDPRTQGFLAEINAMGL